MMTKSFQEFVVEFSNSTDTPDDILLKLYLSETKCEKLAEHIYEELNEPMFLDLVDAECELILAEIKNEKLLDEIERLKHGPGCHDVDEYYRDDDDECPVRAGSVVMRGVEIDTTGKMIVTVPATLVDQFIAAINGEIEFTPEEAELKARMLTDEEYKYIHEHCGLKVGDDVRIAYKTEPSGWEYETHAWKYGKIDYIEMRKNIADILFARLGICLHDGYFYPCTSLIKVKDGTED